MNMKLISIEFFYTSQHITKYYLSPTHISMGVFVFNQTYIIDIETECTTNVSISTHVK